METITKVRRDFHLHGKSIKQIARERGLSRNTVRKVLRSDATEFSYARDDQPYPQLGPYLDELDRLLSENERRSRRERLTLTLIHEALQGAGYAGSYDSVRRYARRWRTARAQSAPGAYVPLAFAPGEAYQFDWSQ